MKNRRIRNSITLIGMTMLFLSLFCVVGVEASEDPATTLDHKTPITFQFTNNPDDTFERMWFSDDGILHMRGAGHDGEVWGDLDGDLTYMGDINLNTETFDGTGGGTVCFDVRYGDLSGTFEGRMVINVDGGYITAKFICHGNGDFEGMHLKGIAGGIIGTTYLADAVILNPHG